MPRLRTQTCHVPSVRWRQPGTVLGCGGPALRLWELEPVVVASGSAPAWLPFRQVMEPQQHRQESLERRTSATGESPHL